MSAHSSWSQSKYSWLLLEWQSRYTFDCFICLAYIDLSFKNQQLQKFLLLSRVKVLFIYFYLISKVWPTLCHIFQEYEPTGVNLKVQLEIVNVAYSWLVGMPKNVTNVIWAVKHFTWNFRVYSIVFTTVKQCYLERHSVEHIPPPTLTLTVLVTTIDAQWEGMGDVGLARYEPALLPPYLTIRVLSYSN